MLVVFKRKLENEIANYFNYELTPYPMSLFKNRKMCSTEISTLKIFLLQNVKELNPTGSTRIFDGSALSWCCDWKRNETFEKNFEKYSNFLSYHSIDVFVFQGYTPSRKDAIHRKRSETLSETVEIKNDSLCTTDQSKFFSNCINKENFLKFLAEKLQKNGFNII